MKFVYASELPKKLDHFQSILLFSSAKSELSESETERIINYVFHGGGLYCGAESWPLQAESNQITDQVYFKKSYGSYTQQIAQPSLVPGNLNLKELDSIPTGKTAVAFPMDYQLRVEAWIDDQPLIQTGKIGKGKIIIDGGYSRFYCNQRNSTTDKMFEQFLSYLSQ